MIYISSALCVMFGQVMFTRLNFLVSCREKIFRIFNLSAASLVSDVLILELLCLSEV